MFTSKVPISHSSVLLLLHLDRLVWTRAGPKSSRNISVFLSSSPQHPGVRRSGHVFPLGQRWCCKALHPKLQHYPMWLKNNDRALVNNYWMRLSRRWRIMQIEEDVIHRARGWRSAVDNILRDLHNSSHRTTVVINSKYLSVLNMLTSSQSFFKTLAYFSARFKDINRRFFLQIILKKKIKSIEQYVCAFLNFFHSVQNRSSAISSSNSCKGHFSVHFCPSSLVSNQIYHRSASFPIKYTIDHPRFQSNISSNRWYIVRIFQIW